MYQIKPFPKTSTPKQAIQTKLKIGQPGDKYEQEADVVADRVMRMSEVKSLRMQPSEEEEEMMQPKLRMQVEEEEEPIQMMCNDCQIDKMVQKQEQEEEELIQPKSNGPQHNAEVDSALQTQINNSWGKGSALDDQTQSLMGSSFGTDFSHVKIHTDSKAHQLNARLNARAFTVGNDIFFNEGNYNPTNSDGKKLLAHELTHVVQQSNSAKTAVQKKEKPKSGKKDTEKSAKLTDLVVSLLRDQLKDASMKKHLSSLGTKLQALALESTKDGENTGVPGAERLAALNISGAFESTSKSILNDKSFKSFKEKLIGFAGGSDEAALIVILAGAIAVVLADIPVKHKVNKKLGKGFSVGGAFDFGSIQSLQFNQLSAYAQYASSYFRSKISGEVSKDKETGDIKGKGTGQIRLGDDLGNIEGSVSINSDGELTLVGKYTGGYKFGKTNKLIFTTNVAHSFASGETIITPGVSGKFSFGSNQSLKLGSSLDYSTDSGLKEVTGYLEYKQNQIRLRIEGSLTGIKEDKGLMPGGDMRIQAMLTIPF